MPTTLEGREALLRDGSFIVVEASPSLLVQVYGHFTLTALRDLAKIHGILYHNQSLRRLQFALTMHACTPFCVHHFTVFKSLSKPRRFIEARRYQHVIQSPVAPVPVIETQASAPGFSAPSTPTVDPIEVKCRSDAHLVPCTEQEKRNIITKFQEKMAVSNFIRRPCAVCSRLVSPSNIFNIHASGVNLCILRNDNLSPKLRPTSYNFEAYDRAILCANALENRNAKGQMTVCGECAKDLEREILPKYALANWLYQAKERLPSDVARAFADATPFERAMVARARIVEIWFQHL
ncbi:hypothetical protein MD484_g4201, partial [Candolleomyces efflorescens]